MTVPYRHHRGGAGWTLAAVFIAAPALLPLAAVAASYFRIDGELWAHFAHHVLPEVAANTFWLLLGVGLGVSILGTALAALIALTEFPGRRFFSWALLLPLAVPGYVLATVYIGILDYAAPFATSLRDLGMSLPEVRSRGGVILVLTLALYPYVYLVARGAFASTGARAMEAARALGHTPFAAFRRVALPLALPWIAGGTLLALMETLADFGTVAAFNYDSFTTAIYKAWFALFSIDAALQLAGALLLVVLALLAAESGLKRGRRYSTSRESAQQSYGRVPLRKTGWLATLICTLVFAIAFLLPLWQLIDWSWLRRADLDMRLARMAGHSLLLAAMAAALTAAAALLLAYALRERPNAGTRAATRIATLGYAFPGPLLALGLFVPYAASINWLNQSAGLGLTVQGGLALMLIAYLVRFAAVAHAPVSNGLLRITPSIDEAARLLGASPWRRLRQVHAPLLSASLGTALLLVFVDVMKEMPITLMTRPFGWDTLAVRIFELTSEGEWQRAAIPSLGIVLAGLLPVWLLNRGLDQERSQWN